MHPRLKTALTLGRVSNLPTVWMNAIAAMVLAAGTLNPATTALVLVALSCFYAGGMCLNDYCDRHWDAERQAYRPIPAGRIKASSVLTLTLGLFAVGMVLLTFAPSRLGVIAGLGLLALITAYDVLHKRHWATVVLMAATRLGVYLVAALAATGEAPAMVIIMGIIQCVYTLAVTVVARWENARNKDFGFPVIPWMIACMGLVDGIALAVWQSPLWLIAGVATLALTRLGQQYVRGD